MIAAGRAVANVIMDSAALRECLRSGSGSASSLPAPRLEQEHILYIVRTTFRAEANPSLEVALHTAAALGKPLVCLAVIEDSHPPSMHGHLSRRPTDRAAAFRLDALRELQPLFAARGTALYVHVERDGCRADAALSLAARACVVVTDEHFGIEPHATSTERVRRSAPVWLCDCHATVPSAIVPAAALAGGNAAFLRATAAARALRVQSNWLPPPASAPLQPPPSDPPPWSSDLTADGAVVRAPPDSQTTALLVL